MKEFEALFYTLNSYSFEKTGAFIHFRESIDKEILEAQLDACGYIDHVDIDNGQYVFSAKPQHWENGHHLFDSKKEFWKTALRQRKVPSCFYILDSKISSIDSHEVDFIRNARAYFRVCEFLTDLADHFDNNDSKLIFFVYDDKNTSKKTLDLNVHEDQISEISLTDATLSKIENLIKAINNKDAHESERRYVIRRTIISFIDSAGREANPCWLLKNFVELEEKYHEQYQVYIYNFSIDAQLNELKEKSLSYKTKILEYIGSSQNRALTIPGALIAVGAIINGKGTPELILILVGVIVVKIIVANTNKMIRDNLDDLNVEAQETFSRYENKDKDNIPGVIESAALTYLETVKKRIKEAKHTTSCIDFIATSTVIAVLTYIFFIPK